METKSFIKKNILLFTLLLGVCLSTMAIDPQFKITGRVTDCTGEPIAGVTIQIKGTTTGTITDLDGNYTIYVSSKDILIFSFINMQTQKIPVGNHKTINVTMQEKKNRLYQLQNQEENLSALIFTKDQIIEKSLKTSLSCTKE